MTDSQKARETEIELQKERLEYATKNGLITVYDVEFFISNVDKLLEVK
jgi:hypothetical protein